MSELFTSRKAVFRPRDLAAFAVISLTSCSGSRWRLRAERPNTSEVGSSNLKQAAEKLGASRNQALQHLAKLEKPCLTAILELAGWLYLCQESLKVTCLLGRRHSFQNISALVSKGDTDLDIRKQWTCLKQAFADPWSVAGHNCVRELFLRKN